MRYFILISLVFLVSQLSAQRIEDLTREISWEKIKLVHEALPDSIHKIFVVTNRPFHPEEKEKDMLPNAISKYREVTYLEAGFSNGDILIRELESFEEGMKSIDTGGDYLLFVHGHGKKFTMSIPRALKIQKRYNISFILFDWPAGNSNFNLSLARVRRCGFNFTNLMRNLERYKHEELGENQSINIISHSLGGYFISHFVVNGSWQYFKKPFIDNLIINAPAIKAKEHADVFSRLRFSKRNYVMLNKNDRVLRGAHLLTYGSMLGNEVTENLAPNTKYIHFTRIARKEHTYFIGYHDFEDDCVYSLYKDLFHGLETSFKPECFDHISSNQYCIH